MCCQGNPNKDLPKEALTAAEETLITYLNNAARVGNTSAGKQVFRELLRRAERAGDGAKPAEDALFLVGNSDLNLNFLEMMASVLKEAHDPKVSLLLISWCMPLTIPLALRGCAESSWWR